MFGSQLQHPAIPPAHDVGSLPDGRPFLAMKLIKGDTLDDLLKRRPDPTHDRGRFVAVCVALGLISGTKRLTTEPSANRRAATRS